MAEDGGTAFYRRAGQVQVAILSAFLEEAAKEWKVGGPAEDGAAEGGGGPVSLRPAGRGTRSCDRLAVLRQTEDPPGPRRPSYGASHAATGPRWRRSAAP